MANFKRKSVQYTQRHVTAKKYGGEYPEILATLADKGMSIEYIGKMFGVSERTIYEAMAKYGDPDKTNRKKRYTDDLICQIYKSKLSIREISDEYHVPVATVGSIKGASDGYIKILEKNGLVSGIKEVKKEAVERECLNQDCKKKFIAENRFLRMCPVCRTRNEKTTDTGVYAVHI